MWPQESGIRSFVMVCTPVLLGPWKKALPWSNLNVGRCTPVLLGPWKKALPWSIINKVVLHSGLVKATKPIQDFELRKIIHIIQEGLKTGMENCRTNRPSIYLATVCFDFTYFHLSPNSRGWRLSTLRL